MGRLIGKMRYALLALLAGAIACGSTQEGQETKLPDPDVIGDAIVDGGDPDYALVKRTQTNVRHYQELRRQGQMRQMRALRRNIGRTVDDNFATYRKLAADKKTPATPRNWAVIGLGFAVERGVPARKILENMIREEMDDNWILANACLSLATLADPETDISHVITLVGHADPEVRTSAATCLKEVWRVRETPRQLTPQLYAAIDSLVGLLNDPGTTRGRLAAAWALANLRHPEVLDYLVSALEDDDEMVQIGGLYGISMLGDARALDPLFEFLDGAPTSEAASWAKKALTAIAVQNGFAKTPSELDALGTSGRAWRKWFRARRNK